MITFKLYATKLLRNLKKLNNQNEHLKILSLKAVK